MTAEQFVAHVKTLPLEERLVIRDYFDVRFGWGHSTFYYKISNANFSRSEKELLTPIIETYLTNPNALRQAVLDAVANGYQLQRYLPRKDVVQRGARTLFNPYEELEV